MKHYLPVLVATLLTAPIAAHASDQPVAKAARPEKVASAGKEERAVDRLQLDPTAITGNRELPKVMSIVPWKAAEPPGGPDRPMGSLIEEVLAPVDRDEFRREITYFRDLTSQSAAATSHPSQPSRPSPGVPEP